MKREIQYDNDDRGRFYIVCRSNSEEKYRMVLSHIHDFADFLNFIEQRGRSYPGYVLKPVPGLHKKLVEENKKTELICCDYLTAKELKLRWPQT